MIKKYFSLMAVYLFLSGCISLYGINNADLGHLLNKRDAHGAYRDLLVVADNLVFSSSAGGRFECVPDDYRESLKPLFSAYLFLENIFRDDENSKYVSDDWNEFIKIFDAHDEWDYYAQATFQYGNRADVINSLRYDVAEYDFIMKIVQQ